MKEFLFLKNKILLLSFYITGNSMRDQGFNEVVDGLKCLGTPSLKFCGIKSG